MNTIWKKKITAADVAKANGLGEATLIADELSNIEKTDIVFLADGKYYRYKKIREKDSKKYSLEEWLWLVDPDLYAATEEPFDDSYRILELINHDAEVITF